MTLHIDYLGSPSPFMTDVWSARTDDAGSFMSIASWFGEVVWTHDAQGTSTVSLRGPHTTPQRLAYSSGLEWWGIRFRTGADLPAIRFGSLVDRFVAFGEDDRRHNRLVDLLLDATGPDDTERLLANLQRHGHLTWDPAIGALARLTQESPSTRTRQRAFRAATGISRRTAMQIERARAAAAFIEHGASIADTVFELGYYDHAHLCRALRRWIGQPPSGLLASH